jgi:hypothetical protein
MAAEEEAPELQADLPDILRLVETLGTARRMGRLWRKAALALADAAQDLERMNGLVVEGEVYTAHWRHSWAACGCRDGKHTWTRDNAWFGRAGWQETRADAQAQADRVRGHLVTQLTAYTPMEVVQ